MKSMEYWWYDHKSTNNSPSIDGLADLMQTLVALDHRLIHPPPSNVSSCTCFIHAEPREPWMEIADPEDHRFVILVSTVPDSIPIPQRPGVYALRRQLPQVANLLAREPERLDRFKRSCEAGKPDMSCFEHQPHEHLIAAYLIGISLTNGSLMELTNLPGDLWTHAQSEYRALGGDTRTAIKIDFVTVSQVVGDIRAVLATVMAD